MYAVLDPVKEKIRWLRQRTFAQMKQAIKMEKSIIRDELKEMHAAVHEKERTLLQYKDQLDEIENVFKEQANNEKLVKDVIENKFKSTISQLNDHLLKQNQKVLEISESIASSQKYRFKIMSMLEEISKKRLRCDPFVRRRAMNLVKGLLKNLDDAALVAQEERENRLREQYRLMLEIQQKIQDEEVTISSIQERNREIDKEFKATSDRIAKEKVEYKEKAQGLKAKDEQTSAKLQSLENIMSDYARQERRKVHNENKSKRHTKRGTDEDGGGQPLSNANYVKHLQEKYSVKETGSQKKSAFTDDGGSSNSSAEEDDDDEFDNGDGDANGSEGSSGSDDDVLKSIRSGTPTAIPPFRKSLQIDGVNHQNNVHQEIILSPREEALGGRPPLLDKETENSLDISVNEGARKNMVDHKLAQVAILKPETTITADGNVMVLPGAYDPINSTRAKRQTFLATPPFGQFTPLAIDEEKDSDDDESGSKDNSSTSGSKQALVPMISPGKSMGIGGVSGSAASVTNVETNMDPTNLYHPVVSSICTACYAHFYQEHLMKHPATMNYQRNSPRAGVSASSMQISIRRNSSFARNHPNVNPLIDCVNQSTFQFTIEESSKVLLECLERMVTRKETTASAHVGGSGLKGGSIISDAMGDEMKQEINSLVKLSLIHQIELPSQRGKSKESNSAKSRRNSSIVKSGSSANVSTETPKLYPNEYLELLFKFHEFCKLILQTIAKNGPKLLLVNNTRSMFAKVLQDILAVVAVVCNVTLYFWDPVVIATRLDINIARRSTFIGRAGFSRSFVPPAANQNVQAPINFALLYVKSSGWIDVFGRQVIDAILHYGQGDDDSPGGQARTKQQEIRRMSRLLQTMKEKHGSKIHFDDEDINSKDKDILPYADPKMLFDTLFTLIQQYFIPDNFQTYHKEKAMEIQSLVSFFLSECTFMINDGMEEIKSNKFSDSIVEDDYRTKTFEISHRNALQCLESFLLTVFHVNDAVIKKSMKKQNSYGGANNNTGNSNLPILLNMMTFYIERAKHDGDNIGKVKSGYVVEKPLISLEDIDDLLIQLAYPQIVPALLAINLLRRVVEEDISKRIFLQKIVLNRPEVSDLQYLNVAMTESEEQMLIALTRQDSIESGIDEEKKEGEDSKGLSGKTDSKSNKKESMESTSTALVVANKASTSPPPPQSSLSPKNRPGGGLLEATSGKVATTKDSLAFSGRKTMLVQSKEFSLPPSMFDEKGNLNVKPQPPGSPRKSTSPTANSKTKAKALAAEEKKAAEERKVAEEKKESTVAKTEETVVAPKPNSPGTRIRHMIALTALNSEDALMIERQITRAEELLKMFQKEETAEKSNNSDVISTAVAAEPEVIKTEIEGIVESNIIVDPPIETEREVPAIEEEPSRSNLSIIIPKPMLVKRFQTTKTIHDQWLNDIEVYIHHLCKQISTVIWCGTSGDMPTETILSSSAPNAKGRFKKKAAIPLPETLIFRILNYIDALRKLIMSRNVKTKEILVGYNMIKSIDGKVAPGASDAKPSEMFKEFQSIIGEIRRFQHRILHIINAMTMPLRRRLHWLQKKYDEFVDEHFSLLTNIENMKKKFDQTKHDIEDFKKSISLIQQEKTQKLLTGRLQNSVNALRYPGGGGQAFDEPSDVLGIMGIPAAATATTSSPTKKALSSSRASTASTAATKTKPKKGSIASQVSNNSSIPGQQTQTISLVAHSFDIQKLILEHASNEYLTKLNSLRQKEAMLVIALKHFQADYDTLSNHSRGLALAHHDLLTSLPPSAERQEVKSVLSRLSFESDELFSLQLKALDPNKKDDEGGDGEGNDTQGSLDAIDQKMRRHQATLNRTTLFLDAYTRDSIASRFLNSFGNKTSKNNKNGLGPGANGEDTTGISGSSSKLIPGMSGKFDSWLNGGEGSSIDFGPNSKLGDILPQYLAPSKAIAGSQNGDNVHKLSGKEWIDIYLKAMGGDTSLHGHAMLAKKNPFHLIDDPNQPGYMKMTSKLDKSIKEARLKWYQEHYDKDGNYIYPDGHHAPFNPDVRGTPKQAVKPKVMLILFSFVKRSFTYFFFRFSVLLEPLEAVWWMSKN